jgi:hypothetical protein
MVTVPGGPSRRAPSGEPDDAGVRVPDPLPDLLVRRATDDDTVEVLALLGTTMGWRADEPNAAFFT